MPYYCYLFGEQMPVTPSKLTLTVKNTNQTLTLLDEGEINFLRYPGLTEVSVPLTFPMLGSKRSPDYYLTLLSDAKTKRQTTQFIITRTTPNGKLLFDTNIKVSVEDYSIEESGENGLDVECSVKLKQYRDYGTKTLTVKKRASGTTTVSTKKTRSTATAPKATTYTIKKGDTLWAIAAKYLGSGAKYTEIVNANKGIISNPNKVAIGTKITIPNK